MALLFRFFLLSFTRIRLSFYTSLLCASFYFVSFYLHALFLLAYCASTSLRYLFLKFRFRFSALSRFPQKCVCILSPLPLSCQPLFLPFLTLFAPFFFSFVHPPTRFCVRRLVTLLYLAVSKLCNVCGVSFYPFIPLARIIDIEKSHVYPVNILFIIKW